MSIYARIDNNAVAELFTPPAGFAIADCFHSDLVWVDVTSVSPAPQPGWTYVGGAFAAPSAPPAPTLAQQASALQAAGLAINSTSAPVLNGTYDCGAETQSHIQAEVLAILVNNTFADGTTTLAWPDKSGTTHEFPSVVAFKTFALAIAGFVAGCAKVINGTSTELPAVTATLP